MRTALPPKSVIRATVRDSRSRRTPHEHAHESAGFTRQLISLCTLLRATSVASYSPLPGEPDTTGFLSWALEQQIRVYLPISHPDHTLTWALHTGAPLHPGKFGILEPGGPQHQRHILNTTDLLLVPACAVAQDGTRLGWGRGYYDRTLADLTSPPPVFAVVHEEEYLHQLPAEPHDRPVNGVVTPQRHLPLPDTSHGFSETGMI